MMCRQRQNSLTMLRNMRRPPIDILVYRVGQWCRITSDALVPGDVISLNSESPAVKGKLRQQSTAGADKEERVVLCDALLVQGSCVVNEAMLTGERHTTIPPMCYVHSYTYALIHSYTRTLMHSCTYALIHSCIHTLIHSYTHALMHSCTHTLIHSYTYTGESVPQMKEAPLGGKDAETRIMDLGNENTAAEWKRHIVYSGTNLLLHNTSSTPPPSGIPAAPDGGCIGIVLRTGYGTTQGT